MTGGSGRQSNAGGRFGEGGPHGNQEVVRLRDYGNRVDRFLATAAYLEVR